LTTSRGSVTIDTYLRKGAEQMAKNTKDKVEAVKIAAEILKGEDQVTVSQIIETVKAVIANTPKL
jgi:hypothetical protein